MKKIIFGILCFSFSLGACSTQINGHNEFEKANSVLYSAVENNQSPTQTIISHTYSSPMGGGYEILEKTFLKKHSAYVKIFSRRLRDKGSVLELESSQIITIKEAEQRFSDTINEIKYLKKEKGPMCADSDFYEVAVWYKGEYYFFMGSKC